MYLPIKQIINFYPPQADYVLEVLLLGSISCLSNITITTTYKLPKPIFDSIYPTYSPLKGGTKLQLNGNEFGVGDFYCVFDGEKFNTFNENGLLYCKTPSKQITGVYTVQIYNTVFGDLENFTIEYYNAIFEEAYVLNQQILSPIQVFGSGFINTSITKCRINDGNRKEFVIGYYIGTNTIYCNYTVKKQESHVYYVSVSLNDQQYEDTLPLVIEIIEESPQFLSIVVFLEFFSMIFMSIVTIQIFVKKDKAKEEKNNELGKLQCVEEISSTSSGVVWKGNWKNVEVAIKIIPIRHINEETIAGLKIEERRMREMHNKFIAQVYGSGVVDGLSVVCMELCEGGLSDLLHSGKIPKTSRLKILRSIAKGMDYLHSYLNVVHGNLKTTNILISHVDQVKLSDFGICRVARGCDLDYESAQYIAPEVLNGEETTMASDIYSYGIIMWEVATLKIPYDGNVGLAIAMNVLNYGLRPKIDKNHNEYFFNLVESCWDELPDIRPSFESVVMLFKGHKDKFMFLNE
ncbi:Serine-threonine protein kinase [Entamoeba marina]